MAPRPPQLIELARLDWFVRSPKMMALTAPPQQRTARTALTATMSPGLTSFLRVPRRGAEARGVGDSFISCSLPVDPVHQPAAFRYENQAQSEFASVGREDD